MIGVRTFGIFGRSGMLSRICAWSALRLVCVLVGWLGEGRGKRRERDG